MDAQTCAVTLSLREPTKWLGNGSANAIGARGLLNPVICRVPPLLRVWLGWSADVIS